MTSQQMEGRCILLAITSYGVKAMTFQAHFSLSLYISQVPHIMELFVTQALSGERGNYVSIRSERFRITLKAVEDFLMMFHHTVN